MSRKDFRVRYFCDVFLPYKLVSPFMVSVELYHKPRRMEYYSLTILILDNN